jgi:uncharacterized protein (DUF433 family)
MEPVFGPVQSPTNDGPLTISFLQLMEIVVVAKFRLRAPGRTSVKLQRIRDAHEFARSFWAIPYPFASLKLREFGGHVLHEYDRSNPNGPMLALDLGGQWVLPGAVRSELDLFDYNAEDQFAMRWYPAGRDVPIVLDPRIGAGRPVILGSGVSVRIIRRRFDAGADIEELADDFELQASDIQQAIRYADLAA